MLWLFVLCLLGLVFVRIEFWVSNNLLIKVLIFCVVWLVFNVICSLFVFLGMVGCCIVGIYKLWFVSLVDNVIVCVGELIIIGWIVFCDVIRVNFFWLVFVLKWVILVWSCLCLVFCVIRDKVCNVVIVCVGGKVVE